MNKFVKLPLFLGVCGAICAGLLAAVNSFTAPIVEKRLENERNANYLELMGVSEADEFKDGTLVDSLTSANVTGIKEVYVGGDLLGVVYDASINDGWSQWTVQVGIKEGKYTGLKYSSTDPDAKGKTFMDAFSKDIVGKTADDDASDIASSSSSPDTVPALRDYVSACASHYAANYENM